MTYPSAGSVLVGARRPIAAVQEPVVVLVVDDDPMVLKTLSQMLSSNGLEVIIAHSSRAALSLLRNNPGVTVVVSDINMPELNGLELAAQLREERTEADALEVIIITGKPTTENAINALRRQVFDFLGKPVRGPILAAAVRRAHQTARMRRMRAGELQELESQLQSAEEQRQHLHGLLRASHGQLESALRDSDRIRREVLAVVSHELRTPLIPILGLSEILLGATEPELATVHLYAGNIREAGQELLRLVEGMLDLLDWEAGTPQLALEPVAVAAVVKQAVASVPDGNKSARDGRFRLSGPSDLHLRADLRRLASALAHLIGNAVKASPAGAPIDVTWSQAPGGGIEIRIIDQGAGISDAMIQDIGIPILQSDMSSTRSWSGLGLGLAIASRAIAGHGGTLVLRRREPSPGTEALVKFPVAPELSGRRCLDEHCRGKVEDAARAKPLQLLRSAGRSGE